MSLQVVLKILGILMILFSTTLLPPIGVSLYTGDGSLSAFTTAFALILVAGVVCWWPVRHSIRELRFRDGFMVVVLFWTVLTTVGAIPLVLSVSPHMSVTDAVFESMSGLTTTGSTVLTGIDSLPTAILYYRQQLQWLGGMGIIVLAVAVMPMLGVGGMQLYRAETPGPIKDAKLTPRIQGTAKALWYLYLGLTVACALAFWLAGMTPFDAITHSFATVATGGFSTHDASIGYYNSPTIAVVATVFMAVSAVNYSLHFSAWRLSSLRVYWKDTEFVVYVAIFCGAALITYSVLLYDHIFNQPHTDLWHAFFDVVSVMTTTGFSFGGFYWWPSFLPVMIVILSAVGGCASSTAGGIKVVRAVLLFKQGRREIVRLVHPNALIPIKLNGKPVPNSVTDAVWGFFALYALSYVVLSLAVMASGSDAMTAFSAVTACINNMGPALGAAAENFTRISDVGKWILTFTMLLGRLEIFTLLVLLSRTFWKN